MNVLPVALLRQHGPVHLWPLVKPASARSPWLARETLQALRHLLHMVGRDCSAEVPASIGLHVASGRNLVRPLPVGAYAVGARAGVVALAWPIARINDVSSSTDACLRGRRLDTKRGNIWPEVQVRPRL
eukprot:1084921-Lingulodinium_polyedra.AAC.2